MDDAPTASDLLTRQFYDWERRGRGWTVWSEPVDLEPAFRPFVGHYILRSSVPDDGQFETGLSRFADSFRRLLGRKDERREPPPIEEPEEPEPESVVRRRDLVELQTLLPANLDIPRDGLSNFFSVSRCVASL